MSKIFQIEIADYTARVYRVTFCRARKGQIPTVVKVEREQDRGSNRFTLHRPDCHGELTPPTRRAMIHAGVKIATA